MSVTPQPIPEVAPPGFRRDYTKEQYKKIVAVYRRFGNSPQQVAMGDLLHLCDDVNARKLRQAFEKDFAAALEAWTPEIGY